MFRCRKWIEFCENQALNELFEKNEPKLEHKSICSQHFEDIKYNNPLKKIRLMCNALPTLKPNEKKPNVQTIQCMNQINRWHSQRFRISWLQVSLKFRWFRHSFCSEQICLEVGDRKHRYCLLLHQSLHKKQEFTQLRHKTQIKRKGRHSILEPILLSDIFRRNISDTWKRLNIWGNSWLKAKNKSWIWNIGLSSIFN